MNLLYHLSLALLSLVGNSPKNHSVLLAPVVNLGANAIACDSYLLDAGNPGAGFLWNTGATSQTLTVVSTGIYWVDVTDGTGTTRDSVYVQIFPTPADPTVNNITLCGAGTVDMIAQSTSDAVFWYDAPTGGNLIGAGDTLVYNATSTQTLYAEAVSLVSGLQAGLKTNTPGGYFTVTNTRGIIFNALQPLRLDSVTVYVDNTLNANLQILNASNAVIFSKPVSMTAVGANKLAVGYQLNPGTGYKLVLANPTGAGKLFIWTSATYPLNYNQIVMTGGYTNATHYNFFYNWKFTASSGCASNRVPGVVSVESAPVVNLGPDSIFCNVSSYLLNADNPGDNYLWNTGATSQTLSTSTSGLYSVLVTRNNGCSDSDSVQLVFNTSAATPVTSDTALCGPQTINLFAQSNGDEILWFDAAFNGNVIGFDETLSRTFNATETVYAQAVLYDKNISDGYAFNNVGGYFVVTNERGLVFNVHQPIVLDSVSIYADNTLSGTVRIYNSANTIVFSKAVSLTSVGKNTVAIGHKLLQGTGYRITLASPSGNGKLFIRTSSPYPVASPYLTITAGYTNTAHYNFFYNWKISVISDCNSGLAPLTVTVQDAPVVDLGADTFLCDISSLTLDAGNPGDFYLWNTGATTQSIVVDSSGVYSVLVSKANGCTDFSSKKVTLAPRPSDPVTTDTSVCSPVQATLHAQGDGDWLVWYDSPSGGRPVSVGEDYSLFASASQTFYVESAVIGSDFTAGVKTPTAGSYFALFDTRGLFFDVLEPIVLDSVTIYVDAQQFGFVQVRDSNNQIVFSKQVIINNNGANPVQLGAFLMPGNHYRLVFASPGGIGKFLINTSDNFPKLYEQVRITGGTTVNAHYNFFYDWKITAQQECKSPNRTPSSVTVEIPVDIQDSLYSCDDFVIDVTVPGATYLWSNASTAASINVDTTGIYWVEINNGAGCILRDSSFVEIPRDAGLPDDGVLCGNTLFTNYDSTAIFLWNTGDSTSSLDITNTGTYWVMVNEPRGCLLYDTITVTGFDVFPTVNLGNDFIICDSAVVDAGNAGLSHLWSTGATSQALTIYSSGSYTVTVTNANGCATQDTIGISVIQRPEAIFFVPDTVSGTNLAVTFNNLSDFGAYFWDFGNGKTGTTNNPVHTYSEPGNYCVTLIVSDLLNNCGTDTVTHCFVLLEYNVGIGDLFTSAGFRVFPNPFSGYLNIRSTQTLPDLHLTLSDPTGRILMETKTRLEADQPTKLNLEDLPSGVYILRSVSGENVQINRIIRN
ncbi:MAG: T9SS type A sorting domain-containing protein [Bacteroidia bacterium]|nr:T9SS type A sorting domain-containing protein [Bacteroidia bacterium]